MERKAFDWDDPKNLKERAWNSVKEFFGKEEEEHPLSPETVAEESQFGDKNESNADMEDHSDRIHRPTEQRSLNERPTAWPG